MSSSKNCKATGYLVGNEIADKITSLGKRKTRNLHTGRKKTPSYWWLDIVLIPYKNGIQKNLIEKKTY